MHAKKVAGKHWLGPSGAMDPKTTAAAAVAANALFIVHSHTRTATITARN
jgi:hypothetical protein